MVNEISYTSTSHSNEGMRLSLGEYNTVTKAIKIWVYQTRFKPVYENGVVADRVMAVVALDSSDFKEYLKLAEKIEFIDLDWDLRWTTSKAKFKAKKAEDGFKYFKLSELTEIR